MLDVRSDDLVRAPHRDLRQRGIDQLDQFLDFFLAQFVGEAGHLGSRTALGDGLDRLGTAQAREILRQQGRAGAAQPFGAVAGSAVFGVILLNRLCRQHDGGENKSGHEYSQ
jgi:hypothetical protein